MSRIHLGVNVDHLATLRQQRRGFHPDPVAFAQDAAKYGADSIVCHLREDRRHIQEDDVRRLRGCVARLNLEMGLAPEIIEIALSLKPDQVTLVPEKRQELTTEGGLDVVGAEDKVRSAVRNFQDAGIEVSLFVDADETQIRASRRVGATLIEIHTGEYADASPDRGNAEFDRVRNGVRTGKEEGLVVAAGHGLGYKDTSRIAAVPEIKEVNIGYSIVVRSLTTGWERALREMRALLDEVRPPN